MAKYGEGDKRWIVEDRPDGANVHNWHWSERDCMEWSRNMFSSLFRSLPILTGEGGLSIQTKTVDKVQGEAYVNIRKGKIIPGYELCLSISWEAEILPSDPSSGPIAKVNGTVEIPYLADENADEDPELRITVRDDDGPVGKRVKDAFFTKGKPVILEKIKEFVKAMAQGGPARDDVDAKKPKSQQQQQQKQNIAGDASGNSGIARKVDVEKKKLPQMTNSPPKKKNDGFKSIVLTERFNCRAKDMYEILMDENRWKGFTQSNARIQKEVGGSFSIFNESVTGTIVELKESKLIVQKWRFSSWADEVYSIVRMEFDEPESGLTIIKLTQVNVPIEDRFGNSTVVENTEKGWKDLIFQRIRNVFGFGM
ncbi:Activator of 90 kDa heat shock protein ATPase [Zostera marina]|uniref:Activator of 90 kDa heat shock protein ATPase n=1 Tax=Zostera marina TaxID=29655 RepID=A0A0K9PRZ7_ZOSMR|nr:Activator of 90 kDa heat shock protein ATPase [Zostera marina]